MSSGTGGAKGREAADVTSSTVPKEGTSEGRTSSRRDTSASQDSDLSLPASPRPPGRDASQSRRRPSTIPYFSHSHSQAPGTFSSWSASSDKQLGHVSSPGAQDRVFPIRSVVSVDPVQTPHTGPRTSGEYDGFPGMNIPGATAFASPGFNRQGRKQSVPDIVPAPTTQARVTQERTDPHAITTAGHGVPTESPLTPGDARQRKKFSASTNQSADPDMHGRSSRMEIFSDSASEKSVETLGKKRTTAPTAGTIDYRIPQDPAGLGAHVTARFKHIVTEGGHAVITGRDGQTLQRCEDEPIHIPGAVQGFGLLIALVEESEGQLVVRVVSENSKRIIGYTPEELFRLDSFTDILSEEQADNLLDHVDFIRDEEADPATNGPEVFTISVRQSKQKGTKLWCAMHINPASPDIIICEFELDDDQMYPLVPSGDETPEPPEDTLQSRPTEEEYAESTKVLSKPLRVLRSARKRRGEAAAMEVFNIMSQVQEQLASASNLEQFLKVLVGVIKELTGFHRVMIYQFDSTFNGRVVTELVDPRATKDLYKGLNFPASDIPAQARDLYKINKVRLLYDRDLETARLVCRTVEDLENPLDLTFSYLRAMSPIHIKYLANMAVRSSMSISINAFSELWGLIACHTYGSKGMRVSFPIRKMCRLVGDTASRNIERLSYASRLQARKLINTVPTEANPSGYIIASSDDLLKLFDADFGLLSIRGETKILGKLEQSQEALAMLEYLRMRKITSVITSQAVKLDFPDLRYQPGFSVIAGLLLVPLSVGGADFIVFFRKGQIKEVKWAGNPYEKFIKEGTEGYLEPRKSFKTWSETVVGKCREWTEEQVETAAVLCLVYGKFIEVWRQKEAALQNSQLTRLLLANSAHEVRTPLNAIINYLEIALEGALDQETRDNLAKSHSASKSLIYVINDLLDLTKTEEGQDLIRDEVFNLTATVREAADVFKGDAKRKGLDYEFIEHPGIPQYVYGDQRRVRQAVANVTANAMQHTSSGWVYVEMGLIAREGQRIVVDIVIQDTGAGMSNEKLDDLFRDLEQVSTDSEELFSTQVADSKQDRTLGLGLAVVSRIVRNMEGQLRLKSEEGKGSRFVIQLPFDVPEDEERAGSEGTVTASEPSIQSVPMPSPHIGGGEVMLVDKASPQRSEDLLSKQSGDDTEIRSFKSASSNKTNRSAKSDVDRFIDAISDPLPVGLAEEDETRLLRSSSKGSGHSRRSVGSFGSSPAKRQPSQHERPGGPIGPMSHGVDNVPEHLRSTIGGPAGTEFVTDNRTMLRAIRMPDELEESPDPQSQQQNASRVTFEVPDKLEAQTPQQPTAGHLQVLVAEDDPLNSKIIKKRLERSGHEIHNTVNGEECASAYAENPAFFDVVLMDMQMPIVDGLTSTKMIRSYEKSHPGDLSARAMHNGRVPVFAVSASLVERERQTYVNAGFDGWILKPIDFKRLNTLLIGIVEEGTRNDCLYRPGAWEQGGWFERRQPDIFKADTLPSHDAPVFASGLEGYEQLRQHPDTTLKSAQEGYEKLGQHAETISNSESGSGSSGQKTPRNESHRPLIRDERLDATEQVSAVADAVDQNQVVEDVSDQSTA